MRDYKKDNKAPIASPENSYFWTDSDAGDDNEESGDLRSVTESCLRSPPSYCAPAPESTHRLELPSAGYINFSAGDPTSSEFKDITMGGSEEDDTSSGEGSTGCRDEERGGWGNKLDFLFSCISVSVGLGNVWRFPYLCYKNGGGAFLVTYFVAMIFCGIPLFFQEVAIGQYLGSGGMSLVGTLCPMLQGAGYATMTIVFLLDVYYCIIIAWTLFYLVGTFTQIPSLPWQSCENWWNTEHCYEGSENHTVAAAVRNLSNQTTSTVEEFWERRVLMMTGGIHDLGGMQWELLICLICGWLIVYLIIWRGLHQSGKIIWFTALFPYVIMLILLVRAISLDGALEGLKFFVKTDWQKLTHAGTWVDGATQIFFGYSIGVGTLPALGSFNKFHHNCYRDAIITCFVNTLTCLLAGSITFSILGYIAYIQDADVADVVKSGPGLVFLTYPEVVLKLPGSVAWAAIFFIMLAILGVDSEFCNVEAFVTGVVDHFSDYLRPIRRKFTLGVCCLMMILGIPMVSKGGVYIFQLMDFYSASGISLLWVCFFQTIAISWFFGVERFCDCIEEMIGYRPNIFYSICWVCLAPAVMLGIFIFYCVQYEPVKYGGTYEYPEWAETIGLCICLSSMIWIPGYAIYYLLWQPNSILENLRQGLTPAMGKMRSNKQKTETKKEATCRQAIPMSESKVVLIYNNTH